MASPGREVRIAYSDQAATDAMISGVVRDSAAQAIERARAGGGPFLLEAMTYRYSGQYEGDTQTYKPPAEVAYWRGRDPIAGFRDVLTSEYGLASGDLDFLMTQVAEEVEGAFEHGRRAPWPEISELTENVYTVYPEGATQS